MHAGFIHACLIHTFAFYIRLMRAWLRHAWLRHAWYTRTCEVLPTHPRIRCSRTCPTRTRPSRIHRPRSLSCAPMHAVVSREVLSEVQAAWADQHAAMDNQLAVLENAETVVCGGYHVCAARVQSVCSAWVSHVRHERVVCTGRGTVLVHPRDHRWVPHLPRTRMC